MKNLYFDLKQNVVLIALKSTLISFLFIFFYICISFMHSSNEAIDREFSDAQKENMYGLVDTLHDPNDFSKFRGDISSINHVADFYNQLNKSDNFNFLSIFDQPIPVTDFKGDMQFDYAFDTERTKKGFYQDEQTGEKLFDVKALQMNAQAFSFFNLSVKKGTTIDWDTVNYDSNVLPILLGSDYNDIYNVGDIIGGSLYFKKYQFKVVGILRENASLFYQNNRNTFIDNYFIIPYPPKLPKATEKDKEFYGILNFAMINGNIAASRDMTGTELLNKLHDISLKSNFSHYTLWSMPAYLIQFNFMYNIIQKNLNLIFGVIALLSLALYIVLRCLDKVMIKRRLNTIKYFWIQGYRVRDINLIVLRYTLTEYMLSAIIFLTVYLISPIKRLELLFILLILQVGYFIIDFVILKSAYLSKLKRSYTND
ncbi:hypothetical protein GHK52_08315 [Lactococcus garvieae]|nr:hypothetical protein [Lactococcus garvieae]